MSLAQRVLSSNATIYQYIDSIDIKEDQLEGFVPVVEDWHAKQCFLKVMLV